MNYDVIIIGAGAAGLMCAAQSGGRGRKVLLVDHAESVGKKIRISGGGRCNFTNIHASPANYISQNPRFCISALKRYTQFDFISLVEKYDIAYHEKTLGQLFCDSSSQQIIDMLVSECESAGVEILLNTAVKKFEKSEDKFTLILSDDKTIKSQSLVIASGGASIPKMGATIWGYDVARQFGINIIDPYPALVPFTLDAKLLEKLSQLSGVSADVVVSCNGESFKEALLFTHRGLSGPAILQISSYWSEGDVVAINFAPDLDVMVRLKNIRQEKPRQELHTSLAEFLPKRLAQYLAGDVYQKRMADFSNEYLQKISYTICTWQVIPSGTEGYRTAEVTLGGIDTDELSSKTFEARKVKGLYFIGEVIDVTGHLGGYNFQWAWSSAYAAGQFV